MILASPPRIVLDVLTDRKPIPVAKTRKAKAKPAPKVAEKTFEEVVAKLERPRVLWLMLPAGKPVEQTLFAEGGLVDLLDPGDFVIDGGNSLYKEAAERGPRLAEKGIHFLDCGTSGGPGGARHGACLMI